MLATEALRPRAVLAEQIFNPCWRGLGGWTGGAAFYSRHWAALEGWRAAELTTSIPLAPGLSYGRCPQQGRPCPDRSVRDSVEVNTLHKEHFLLHSCLEITLALNVGCFWGPCPASQGPR